MAIKSNLRKSIKGITFIRVFLIIALFLGLTSILFLYAMNALRLHRVQSAEEQAKADVQLMVKRMADFISKAKKVDVADSLFTNPNGKLTLVLTDNSTMTFEQNPVSHKTEITKKGIKSDFSAKDIMVKSLDFEKIADNPNDPDMIRAVNVRLVAGASVSDSLDQDITFSTNLENGDFDGDGTPDTLDLFPRNPECGGDADSDGVCDALDNAPSIYNPFQDDISGAEVPECNPDPQIIGLMSSDPPLGTLPLKKILIAAAPLSPAVLSALIVRQDSDNLMGVRHFRDILAMNTKLPDAVYQKVLDMRNFPNPYRQSIIDAQSMASALPATDSSLHTNPKDPPVRTLDPDIFYCPGGCAADCGDGGSGILTGHSLTDKCYRSGDRTPEWCSRWFTFKSNTTDHPAYMGGSQADEETAYWEKTFKTTLSQAQLKHLESITVGGKVAYQNATQPFCDLSQSTCPMHGQLSGDQDIELWNWQTGSWEKIGPMAVDGSTSHQQTFEAMYKNNDVVTKFVGGEGARLIKARMPFHWKGVPLQGNNSAPAFMLIDYFTLHLKW